MNQTTFTRGPVKAELNRLVFEIYGPECTIAETFDCCNHDEANAQLIVAAFNAATAAQDMGFDGIKAVEALPKLLEACRETLSEVEKYGFGGQSGAYGTGRVCADMLRAAIVLAQAGQKPRGKDCDTPEGT